MRLPLRSTGGESYHQLFVDDHLADYAVDCGHLQLKHLRQRLHAEAQTKCYGNTFSLQ